MSSNADTYCDADPDPDVEGQGQHFRVAFHHNGSTGMARMLKIYADRKFDGLIRPDHAPTMEGEANSAPGHAMMGKVFALGFMKKGIIGALDIAYE
jgi:mannonate dehydratase